MRGFVFVTLGAMLGLLGACDCGGATGNNLNLDASNDRWGSIDLPNWDLGTDATPADLGTDTFVPECANAADCTAQKGAPPCGSWTCPSGLCVAVCPGCTDADGDGYGVGTCAGPDCDDADRSLGADGVRSCYPGPANTAGIGVCRAGTELCVGGTLSGCSGFVVPGGEACNALDDDCNGLDDDGLPQLSCGIGQCARTVNACVQGNLGTCMPGQPLTGDFLCDGQDDDCDGLVDEDCTCIHVAPNGNDQMAVNPPLNAVAFRTVQAAIDFAAADPTAPRIICVAGGAACTNSATYAADVAMADGISVYGRYEATTWTRCAQLNTVLAPSSANGVSFDPTVQSTTVLSGFRITRAAVAMTAGITIDASVDVTIDDVVIDDTNTAAATRSYGVSMSNGAIATVQNSSIMGGSASVESIGIRSVDSRPTIRRNCATYDAAGHCTAFCGASPNLAIRGRFTGSGGTGTTYGILLDNSPDALVDANAICGNDGDVGAGIAIRNDAANTVIRANLVNAWGGALDSHGVWLEDCDGAAPWLVDNQLIAAAGDTNATRTDGIRAIGDCHPVIDSNVHITGGGEGGSSGANGVYCGANASGVASRCAVLGNLLIDGSTTQFPPTSVGVRCDDGGCLRIEDNVITGRGGVLSWGIHMGESGTFVARNVVSGGCASNTAVGIRAEGSFARFENNFVHGFDAATCPAGSAVTATLSIGLHVLPGVAPNEIDFHSNSVEAHGRPAATCTAVAVQYETTLGSPPSAQGVFRNDVLRVDQCSTRHLFFEAGAAFDPRIIDHLDFDPTGTPMSLYFDEGTTGITTAAAIDALTDVSASSSLSVPASFLTYPTDLHVDSNSMLLGAGTPTGAPTMDFDRMTRSTTAPAIGADER